MSQSPLTFSAFWSAERDQVWVSAVSSSGSALRPLGLGLIRHSLGSFLTSHRTCRHEDTHNMGFGWVTVVRLDLDCHDGHRTKTARDNDSLKSERDEGQMWALLICVHHRFSAPQPPKNPVSGHKRAQSRAHAGLATPAPDSAQVSARVSSGDNLCTTLSPPGASLPRDSRYLLLWLRPDKNWLSSWAGDTRVPVTSFTRPSSGALGSN